MLKTLSILLYAMALASALPAWSDADEIASIPRSVQSLRLDAQSGDPDAMFALAEQLEKNASSQSAELIESVRWYRSAAAEGHTTAQRKLGMMHMTGLGVPQSHQRAYSLFNQAAQKGDLKSQFRVASLLATGQGVDTDIKTAVKWFERAAKRGHLQAQLELGNILLLTSQVNDPQSGIEWIRKSAESDYPPAHFRLAQLLESGEYVQMDAKASRQHYLKAVNLDDPSALLREAKLLLRPPTPEYDAAFELYKRAAAQGSAEGHYGLAHLQLESLISKPNHNDALDHLKEAAKLGHAEAHYAIGLMYASGALTGGALRAVEHFRRSAKLGHPPAMYELALTYYKGIGRAKSSPASAAKWWKRAASLGHIPSQYAYALAHANGIGVKKNKAVGFALANVAAAQGHVQSQRLRDQLKSRLSDDQLVEAQTLSIAIFSQYVSPSNRANAEALR